MIAPSRGIDNPCWAHRIMNSGIASPIHGAIPRELHVLRGGTMKSAIVKRSVVVGGHKTSITLEDAFWGALKEIAQAKGSTVTQTLTQIDETRQQGNLSSAIRLFVLDRVRNRRQSKEARLPPS